MNGPIARWAIIKALDLTLAQQGMAGATSIKGSISSGFTLTDFSYTGQLGLQEITFAEAAVRYDNLLQLSKGKIGHVLLSSAVIVLDLDAFPPSSKKKQSQPLKDTLATLQHWISQPDITLSSIDITLLKSSKPFAQFQLASLQHDAGSETFSLQQFIAHDGASNTTPAQQITLAWAPQAVELAHLEVLPDISLQNTTIDWSSSIIGSTQLQLLGATFQLNLADSLTASLISGTLDTQEISQRFQIDLPATASLSALSCNIQDWKKPVPDWDIALEITAPTLSYEATTLRETQLRISQNQQRYSAALTTAMENTPISIDLEGQWSDPSSQQWWKSTTAHYKIQSPQLNAIPTRLLSIPKELNTNQATVALEGAISITELDLTSLTSDLTLDGLTLNNAALPKLTAVLNYQHRISADLQIAAQRADQSPIKLDAHYQFEDDSYSANLQVQESQPAWLNSLLKAFAVDIELKNSIDIAWSGTGTSDLQLEQKGTLSVKNLTLSTQTVRDCAIIAEANYQWPESVSITNLQIKEPNFSAGFQLEWADKTITIYDGLLSEKGTEIANFRAQIPFHQEINSLQKFFAQQAPWALSLHTSPLSITQLTQWIGIKDVPQIADLEGAAALSLEIAGSPDAPHVNGVTRLENLRGIANKDLDPLHMLGSFATANDQLYFSGELLEAQTQRATLSLELPFTPTAWLNGAEPIGTLLQKAPIAGSVEINQLPLNRIARFVKQLAELKGDLTGSAKIAGTLADPQVELSTQIKIPQLIVAGSELDDIRDIEINCKANSKRQVEADLKASINGGNFSSKATADITNLKDPSFEVTFKTNHAMVFRNDSISVRANADIKLAGTLDDATISGNIGLVESLFYKDIDILPIGVPSSAVADVELPSLNSGKLTPDIPAPFGNWKLNVNLSMQDPLLIRGNLAGGQIEGSINAAGTLNAPTLKGSIIAEKVVARLPFSVLKIEKGYAHFSPENGLIPTLDIQGKSTIGNYDTSLYVYGTATSPKTSFTSSPPLPQNDIMTLLATGVTTSGLSNNKEVATLRALQLFLVKIRQESGGSKGTELLEKILGGIQSFEFNINETDHFTGRKYSSAKANINKRLYFTAQIDGQKQTRGLLVFIIKSR